MFDEIQQRGEDRPLPHQELAAVDFMIAYNKINMEHFDGRGSGRSWFWVHVIKYIIMHDFGVFWKAKEGQWFRGVIGRATQRYGSGGLRT